MQVQLCPRKLHMLGQPGRESIGLALAHTNPIVPRVARTNPVWDQTGLAIWAVVKPCCETMQIKVHLNMYTLINLQPLKMVFHFKWKSREIRLDKGRKSVLSEKQLEKFCFSIEFNFDSK